MIKQTENAIFSNYESWLEGEFLIQFLINLLFITGLLLAAYNSSWALALVLGSTALIIFYLTKYFRKSLLGYSSSLSLGLLSAQISIQTLDYLQTNIVFFVCVAALILYSSWRVFTPISFIFITQEFLSYAMVNNKAAGIINLELAGNMVFFFVEVAICASVARSLNIIRARKESVEKKFDLQCQDLDNSLNYAKEIAAGNFEAKMESSSENLLGSVLSNMSQNLKTAAREDRNRNWTVIGISKIAEIIRLANHNMETLSNELISFLVKYLKATQGGVFVFIDEENGQKYLELKGCYAYQRKKFLDKRVALGQGLLGQAVLGNETIYLTEIPQNYFQITSGLGESNPNSLIIVPLKVDEQVVGALELASFNKFEDFHRDFLEKVSETIASSIIFSKNNNRTNKLLDESQVLTEQLRAQEEEVRQNMEELQATQEDVQRKNIEMEKAEKELLSTQEYLNSVINAIPNPIFVKDDNIDL